MHITLYNNLADVPVDQGQWDALLPRNTTRSVFQTYTWVHSWWEQFGDSFTLFFLVARNDAGAITGLAPLMIDDKSTLRFIADINSDYLDFIIPEHRFEILTGFFDKIVEHRNTWRVIELKNVRRCSDLLDLLRLACKQSHLYFWRYGSIDAPSLIIDGNEKCVRKLLDKYSIRRTEKRFARQGEIVYRVLETREQAAPYWDTFFAQHVDRCESVNRGSSFENPAFRRFTRDLFNQTCGEHFVHFSVVELNGKPIAFHYGFISENRLLWYKPCFDASIKKGSPGVLLIKRLIEECMNYGLQELDFTIGAEQFKDRFCSIRRKVDSVRIYQSRLQYLSECTFKMMWNTAKTTARKLLPGKRYMQGCTAKRPDENRSR